MFTLILQRMRGFGLSLRESVVPANGPPWQKLVEGRFDTFASACTLGPLRTTSSQLTSSSTLVWSCVPSGRRWRARLSTSHPQEPKLNLLLVLGKPLEYEGNTYPFKRSGKSETSYWRLRAFRRVRLAYLGWQVTPLGRRQGAQLLSRVYNFRSTSQQADRLCTCLGVRGSSGCSTLVVDTWTVELVKRTISMVK